MTWSVGDIVEVTNPRPINAKFLGKLGTITLVHLGGFLDHYAVDLGPDGVKVFDKAELTLLSTAQVSNSTPKPAASAAPPPLFAIGDTVEVIKTSVWAGLRGTVKETIWNGIFLEYRIIVSGRGSIWCTEIDLQKVLPSAQYAVPVKKFKVDDKVMCIVDTAYPIKFGDVGAVRGESDYGYEVDFIEYGLCSVRENEIELTSGQQSKSTTIKKKNPCECGAHSLGAEPLTPNHSYWCPMYVAN